MSITYAEIRVKRVGCPSHLTSLRACDSSLVNPLTLILEELAREACKAVMSDLDVRQTCADMIKVRSRRAVSNRRTIEAVDLPEPSKELYFHRLQPILEDFDARFRNTRVAFEKKTASRHEHWRFDKYEDEQSASNRKAALRVELWRVWSSAAHKHPKKIEGDILVISMILPARAQPFDAPKCVPEVHIRISTANDNAESAPFGPTSEASSAAAGQAGMTTIAPCEMTQPLMSSLTLDDDGALLMFDSAGDTYDEWVTSWVCTTKQSLSHVADSAEVSAHFGSDLYLSWIG